MATEPTLPQIVKDQDVVESMHDPVKLTALENRIVNLEHALRSLLEEQKKNTEDVKSKPTVPVLSDDELCLPSNWTLRFKWRRRNHVQGGEEYIEIESPDRAANPGQETQISLIHDEDVRGLPQRIFIKSNKIQSRFRNIHGIETFGEVRLNVNSIEIHEPFSPLFHYIEEVKQQIYSDTDATSFDKADMHALEMFCTQGPIGSMFQNLHKLIEQGLITADQQWTLFRPGILVVTKILGEIEVLRVKSIGLEERNSYYRFYGSNHAFPGRYVICAQIAWNGKVFGERDRKIRLQKFPGSKKIVELDLCPMDSFPANERQKIKEQAMRRGKVWKMLCGNPSAVPKDCDTRCFPLLSETRGYWDPFTGEEKRGDPVERRISGRVIVDPAASAKASKLGTMTESFNLNTSEIEPFTEESYRKEDVSTQYLKCSSLIEVFSLTDGLWYRVPVPSLVEPEWTTNPWDQLELSDEKKQLLLHLVNAHTIQNNRSEDLIKNKGKGLVCLFHGEPGLGKTLTAEALSESIKRPLYRVNLGLLTHTANWEPTLEQIFRDAHSWQAVLLLDEAEVIMEARTKDRMEQNSWCSAFLRKLDYYEGILILTTNMIHSIDKAFRSRINIAVHYEELSIIQKTNLWRLFIEKLHPDRADIEGLRRKVDMWAKQNLNGRQIRNVVLTAEALAFGESNYLRMNADHVERIIRDTFEFNRAIDNQKKRRENLQVGSVPQNW